MGKSLCQALAKQQGSLTITKLVFFGKDIKIVLKRAQLIS
jgi:hypothetical protein